MQSFASQSTVRSRRGGRRASRGCAVARAAVAAVALTVAGCSTGPGADSGAGSSDPAADLSGSLTVFAASSLTEAYTALADAFMAAYPDIDVRLNFAGSTELAAQIAAGAPVDVVATADATSIAAAAAGLASGDDPVPQPARFATNDLQIVVEAGNPRSIEALADLADPEIIVVLCDEEVPCGRYSAKALAAAGLTLVPASREQSAKAVLSKVLLGEADAGIVYRTDVVAAGDAVTGVEVPAAENAFAEYWLAARRTAAAAAFADFVLSDAGRSILESFGFGLP